MVSTDRGVSLFEGLEDDEPEAQAVTPVPEPEVAPAPEAAPTPVPTFGLNSTDDVRTAAEQSEALRNYLEKVKLDAENTARQRYQNEMRREQGSVERANAYHQSLIDRLNNGDDIESLKKDTPMFVTANYDAVRAEVLSAVAQQAIEMAPPEEQAALRDLLTSADGVGAIDTVAGKAVAAMVQRASLDTLANLDPETLKDHPRISEWLTNQVKQQVEAEMNAQKITANTKPSAPAVPTGGVGTGGYNAVEIAQMDQKARDKFFDGLTEAQQEEVMVAMYEAAGKGL